MPFSFQKRKRKKQNKTNDALKLCLSDEHDMYKEYIIIKCRVKISQKILKFKKKKKTVTRRVNWTKMLQRNGFEL